MNDADRPNAQDWTYEAPRLENLGELGELTGPTDSGGSVLDGDPP